MHACCAWGPARSEMQRVSSFQAWQGERGARGGVAVAQQIAETTAVDKRKYETRMRKRNNTITYKHVC